MSVSAIEQMKKDAERIVNIAQSTREQFKKQIAILPQILRDIKKSRLQSEQFLKSISPTLMAARSFQQSIDNYPRMLRDIEKFRLQREQFLNSSAIALQDMGAVYQQTERDWKSHVLQMLKPIAAQAGVKWHNVNVHFPPEVERHEIVFKNSKGTKTVIRLSQKLVIK